MKTFWKSNFYVASNIEEKISVASSSCFLGLPDFLYNSLNTVAFFLYIKFLLSQSVLFSIQGPAWSNPGSCAGPLLLSVHCTKFNVDRQLHYTVTMWRYNPLEGQLWRLVTNLMQPQLRPKFRNHLYHWMAYEEGSFRWDLYLNWNTLVIMGVIYPQPASSCREYVICLT